MGIQDRDYYREHHRRQRESERMAGVQRLARAKSGRSGLLALLVWVGLVGVLYSAASAWLQPPKATLVVAPSGRTVVELRRARDGHYSVDGFVNGAPVRFMVDTGASITSLPRDLAKKAGVGRCVDQTFLTAAGAETGCVGRAASIEFAGLRFVDFEVAVMPRMQGTALLGMNMLSTMHMEQRGQVLRLAPADTSQGGFWRRVQRPMP